MRTNNPAEQRSEFTSLLSSQTTNIRIDSQTTNIRIDSQTTNIRIDSQTTNIRIDSQTTNIRIDLQTTTNIRILALRELLEDRINHTSHMSVLFAKLIKMKLRNATKVLAADNLSTVQLITKIIPEKHIVLGNKLPGRSFRLMFPANFTTVGSTESRNSLNFAQIN